MDLLGLLQAPGLLSTPCVLPSWENSQTERALWWTTVQTPPAWILLLHPSIQNGQTEQENQVWRFHDCCSPRGAFKQMSRRRLWSAGNEVLQPVMQDVKWQQSEAPSSGIQPTAPLLPAPHFPRNPSLLSVSRETVDMCDVTRRWNNKKRRRRVKIRGGHSNKSTSKNRNFWKMKASLLTVNLRW